MSRLSPSSVIAIALAGCLSALIAAVLLFSPTGKAVGLRVYRGSSVLQQAGPSGAVMFYVTNGEPGLVHLARLEVQVASSNGWKTVSTESSGMFNPGAPSYHWAGGLLAGSCRTFCVQPPLEGRWRVRPTYLRAEQGLYSFRARAQALVRRLRVAFTWSSLFQWGRGNVFRLADQHEVMSQEFSQ
jgi:hypothetical protein